MEQSCFAATPSLPSFKILSSRFSKYKSFSLCRLSNKNSSIKANRLDSFSLLFSRRPPSRTLLVTMRFFTLAAALTSVATAAPSAARSALDVKIESAGNSGQVKTTITKTGKDNLKIFRHGTIFDNAHTEKAAIEANGSNVEFQGLRLRLSTDNLTDFDFQKIDAGQSVAAPSRRATRSARTYRAIAPAGARRVPFTPSETARPSPTRPPRLPNRAPPPKLRSTSSRRRPAPAAPLSTYSTRSHRSAARPAAAPRVTTALTSSTAAAAASSPTLSPHAAYRSTETSTGTTCLPLLAAATVRTRPLPPSTRPPICARSPAPRIMATATTTSAS